MSAHALTFGSTTQFALSINNDFHLGYLQSTSESTTNTNNCPDPFQTPPNLNSALGIRKPQSAVSSYAYIRIRGLGDAESTTDNAYGDAYQWNLRDTLGTQVSSRILKFGIDQQHIVADSVPALPSVDADFFGCSSIISNHVSELYVRENLPARPVLNEFSAFFQDDFRVANRLTRSSGLSWDFNPAPKVRNGQSAYTVPGDIYDPAILRVAPRGTPLWSTSLFNFAPRLGIAWTPYGSRGREFVVRGGAGLYFDIGHQAAMPAYSV